MRLMLMRTVLLAALLTVAAATSHAQTDPYQWVGITSLAFTGNGNGTGFVGMTSQCRADFGPGARMCKSVEVMDSDTLNFNAIPSVGCWLRPTWSPIGGDSFGGLLDESGVVQEPFLMTCQAWTTAAFAGPEGLILTPAGGFDHEACSVARPVACCKPTPIPAPSASLSLPIGVGALAALASMKGGA
jgi:hypothetical protein